MAVVELTPEAATHASKLPRPIRARIMRLVKRLEAWPNVSGVKPLTGNLAGKYRMRTGDYRLQFVPKGETIVVERIGHRDGFYKD